MNSYVKIILIFMFTSFSVVTWATQCVSTGSGDWGSDATWSCGSVPGCGDTITILAGHTVRVAANEDYSGCTDPTFLIVEGTLTFKSGRKLYFPLGSGIIVEEGGEINCGCGGGGSNVIDIGPVSAWTASDGPVIVPTVYGALYITDVISIASGNWSNVASWDCTCIPDSLNNVTVDVAHTITLDADATSANFKINGAFNYSGAFMLDISQDFNNNGTYTAGQGGVKFDGGIAQSISGAVTTGTFANITVAAGSSVTHTLTSIILTGNLLVESGSFNSGNVMTLRSDASGTANIGDLTNGTFTGNVIMERMIPAGATDWRFQSSGLSGQTISDWNDDFITSGFLGSDVPSYYFKSIYTYSESFVGHKDSGYVAVSSVAEALGAGQGFYVWSGDNLTGTAAFTIDLVGSINQGNISLPVSFTNSGTILMDGWNLVGNPYPSAIDWDATTWTKTNIDDAIYVWDPNTAAYTSYVGGVGNNGGSSVIASSQAFWVKANAAGPNLTAVESVKSTSLADPYKAFTPNQLIRIALTPNDSSSRDETTISFNPNATDAFESSADAVKIKSIKAGVVYISTNSSDNQKLSINSLSPGADVEIPVYVQVPSSGIYQFDIIDLGGIDAAACIHVRNESTSAVTPLTSGLSFSENVNATGFPFHKFTLIVSAKNSVEITEPSCAQVNDGEVIVTNSGNGPWAYNIWSMDDSLFALNSSSNSSNVTSYNNLSPGTYVIEVENNSICPTRTNKVIVPAVDSTLAVFNSELAGIVLIDDYEFSFLNESSNADSYVWDFGDGGESQDIDPLYYFNTPGEYEIVLTASKNNVCTHKTTKKILVLDVEFGEDSSLSAHVFPNPVHQGESVLLHFNKHIEDANIQIHDMTGKLVYTHYDYIESTQTMLELGDLSAGVYLIKIVANESSTSFKLIVK